MFCDLRGFTAFAETVEPEDVMVVLAEYHAALGDLVHRFEGTLERFTGDGVDGLLQRPDPVRGRARSGRCGWPSRCARGSASSPRAGAARATTSSSAIGIAQGHATLGRIGFEGRSDYAAIGSVTNLAARLCAEATAGQILISQRVHSATEDMVTADAVGDLTLRGFSRPMPAFNVIGLDEAGARA